MKVMEFHESEADPVLCIDERAWAARPAPERAHNARLLGIRIRLIQLSRILALSPNP